ncbi:galactosylceramide sulfotransferase-like [Saccoglossus kowalevskii]
MVYSKILILFGVICAFSVLMTSFLQVANVNILRNAVAITRSVGDDEYDKSLSLIGDKDVTDPVTLSCTPRTNIVMLKTHKTGSSTLQNILFRYADKHNLTLVLPKRSHLLGYPHKFNSTDIIHVPWHEYNILTHHTVFNFPEMKKLMPPDTAFITILRHPVTQFESAFGYFAYRLTLNMSSDNKLETYLAGNDKYFFRQHLLHNNYMFDLGIPYNDWNDIDRLEGAIHKLNLVFNLVLIMEYFEESMVLLRHLMCWDVDDVVFLALNVRGAAAREHAGSEITTKIEEWNSADFHLYKYFNKTFWEKVKRFGETRMENEVEVLKNRLRWYRDKCISGITQTGNKGFHPKGVKMSWNTLNPDANQNRDCVDMTRSEIKYTEILRKKLNRRILHYR